MARKPHAAAAPLEGAAAMRLQELVPDEPQWIDLCGILRTGRCRVWVAGEAERGLAARSFDHSFVSVFGPPGEELAAAVTAAVAGGGATPHVLAPSDQVDWLAQLLPQHTPGRVIFHRLPRPVSAGDPPDPPPPGFEIVRLAPDSKPPAPDLRGLPPALRSEIAVYLAQVRPLVAARVAGESRLVSFCAAPLASETLWDVSVDTLASFRRRGLAAACFSVLAPWLAAERSLQPVWGAHHDNFASLALAARLGFEPVAESAELRPPERTSDPSAA